MIYTSEHYSTALLEKLVHTNLVMPANQHFIEITIPNGVSYEIFQTAAHPGWDSRNETICKTFGQQWCEEKRSALLIVPSIPARLERNFLINPAHPDAKGIRIPCPSRCGGMSGFMRSGSDLRSRRSPAVFDRDAAGNAARFAVTKKSSQ